MKKIKKLSFFIVLAYIIASMPFLLTNNTYAATCGSNSTIFLNCSEGGDGSVYHVVVLIIDILSIGIGILGLIGVLTFGIMYLTAGTDASKAAKARRRFFEVLIGLALYASLYGIAKWLLPGGTFNGWETDAKEDSIQHEGEVHVGETVIPVVKVGEDLNNMTYTLASSDPKIALISFNAVRCVNVGKVTITATASNGAKGEMPLECLEKATETAQDDENEGGDGNGEDQSSGGGSSGENDSSKKSIIIILGASQILRIAGGEYANINSYSGKKSYSTSDGTLNFVYQSGSGKSFQTGEGWGKAAGIIDSHKDEKDKTKFYIYFTLVGNDIKKLTCNAIQDGSSNYFKDLVSDYSGLISKKKDEGYSIQAYLTSMHPVRPSDANNNPNVVENSSSKKCSSGYRSNYKYKLYNNAAKKAASGDSNISFVDTFSKIMNSDYKFTGDWSGNGYVTTDGIHWNNATAKKYFESWMKMNSSL